MIFDKLGGTQKLTEYVSKKLPVAVQTKLQSVGIGETLIQIEPEPVWEPTDLNRHLPKALRDRFQMCSTTSKISDVRFSVNQPVAYVFANGTTAFIDRDFKITKDSRRAEKVTPRDLDAIVNHLSANALYAYKTDLINGFITLPNGHRVGVSGVVNSAQEYKYVLSLNFRIFRDIRGTARDYMGQILGGGTRLITTNAKQTIFNDPQYTRPMVRNTLIISPPARGKTTLLRDIARQLSCDFRKVAVIDTRGELTAHHGGSLQVDLGPLASVSVGGEKHLEIIKSVRAMSPEVIVTDEIGTMEDIKALKYCLTSGVSIICTIHGSSASDAQKRLGMELKDIFQEIIIL